MSIGITTLVAGRRRALAGLLGGLLAQSQAPDAIVIVRMDGKPIELPAGLRARVVDVPAAGNELPLAAARNAGVRALDTDRVVMLDVDCIPTPGLIAGYDGALERVSGIVCGEVRYLPPGADPAGGTTALTRLATAHPARPAPGPGELFRQDSYPLAWTTSLGLHGETFDAAGGFDERFIGYGGEDTDFTERLRQLGVGVWWSGDALALHQDHGSSGPPRQHVRAIVRNASLFYDLHGWWPMRGWLEVFAADGLVTYDADRGLLEESS